MKEISAVLVAIAVLTVVASPFALILIGAIHRAKQRQKIAAAAEKFINS